MNSKNDMGEGAVRWLRARELVGKLDGLSPFPRVYMVGWEN